jgi:hypothetical protein
MPPLSFAVTEGFFVSFLSSIFLFVLDDSPLLSLSELLLEAVDDDAELAELMIAFDFGAGFSGFFSGSLDFSTVLAEALGRGFGAGGLGLLFFDTSSDSELFSGEKILFFLFAASFLLFKFFPITFLGTSLLLPPLFDMALTGDFDATCLLFVVVVTAALGVIVALLLGLAVLFRLIAGLGLESSSDE